MGCQGSKERSPVVGFERVEGETASRHASRKRSSSVRSSASSKASSLHNMRPFGVNSVSLQEVSLLPEDLLSHPQLPSSLQERHRWVNSPTNPRVQECVTSSSGQDWVTFTDMYQTLTLQHPPAWRAYMEEGRSSIVVTPGVGVASLRLGPEILRHPLSTQQYKEKVNKQVGRVFPGQRIVENKVVTWGGKQWVKVTRDFSRVFEGEDTPKGDVVELQVRQCSLLRTQMFSGECVAFAHTWTCSQDAWELFDPIFQRIASSIQYSMS